MFITPHRISELNDIESVGDGARLPFEGRGQRFRFWKVLYAAASREPLIRKIAANKAEAS